MVTFILPEKEVRSFTDKSLFYKNIMQNREVDFKRDGSPQNLAFYPPGLFWCELQSFGANSCRDVCILSHMMELDDTQLVMFKVPKKKSKFEKLNTNVSFQKS